MENHLSVSSVSNESKYITNKRKHEVVEIAKELFKLCKHYHCKVFSMEDLNVSGLIKNRRLAYSIADVRWSQLLTFIKYKCEWYGKAENLIHV